MVGFGFYATIALLLLLRIYWEFYKHYTAARLRRKLREINRNI